MPSRIKFTEDTRNPTIATRRMSMDDLYPRLFFFFFFYLPMIDSTPMNLNESR
jgi:hypothetical protein